MTKGPQGPFCFLAMMQTAITPEEITAKLHAAGRVVSPADLRLETREDRLLIQWPGDELAWAALNANGAAQLAHEGRVLARVQSKCLFKVPEERYRSPDDNLSIRSVIAGRCDPAAVHQRLRNDAAFAKRVGHYMGEALAQLHACLSVTSVPAWFPRQVTWPMPHKWMVERLPRVLGEQHPLLPKLIDVLRLYQACVPPAGDLVLAHTDAGLHNLVFDDALTTPLGIIDFEGTAFVDRHHDFRYLLLDIADTTLLDTAIATYESLTNRQLDRSRIVLYHAACACCYLAFRDGIAPELSWCGRTLDEDLAWTQDALAALARC